MTQHGLLSVGDHSRRYSATSELCKDGATQYVYGTREQASFAVNTSFLLYDKVTSVWLFECVAEVRIH